MIAHVKAHIMMLKDKYLMQDTFGAKIHFMYLYFIKFNRFTINVITDKMKKKNIAKEVYGKI